ncbi:hypothetical protein [Legionella maioricensis]|uniref:Uncharacterized protein n=1 Tax=Legionella maioricensis TaxID=2896528 RepID=A0A9X2I8F3_9GAMM|nr:hypothetical protein [Legionella maioricensis]MCL9682744.1 hypothetical protein [Legionella maioricensis]MCL9687208.1 hypothetical protein [Legionella maioricensis]
MYAKYDISNDVKSVETIAFLDLTGGKEFNLADVKLLPLKEVVEQIKLDTGREIKINNKTALESIGIVKYDLPLDMHFLPIRILKKIKYYLTMVVREQI